VHMRACTCTCMCVCACLHVCTWADHYWLVEGMAAVIVPALLYPQCGIQVCMCVCVRVCVCVCVCELQQQDDMLALCMCACYKHVDVLRRMYLQGWPEPTV